MNEKLLAAVEKTRRTYHKVLIDEFMGKLRELNIQDEAIGGFKTEADMASEIDLMPGLLELFPKASPVAEETVKLRPETLAGLNDEEFIILDSLDGTSNYVRAARAYAAHMEKPGKGEKPGEFVLDTGMIFGIIAGYADKNGLKYALSLEATYRDEKWDSRVLAAERGNGVWVSEGEGQPFVRVPPLSESTLRRVNGKPVVALEPEVFNPGILQVNVEKRSAKDVLAELNSRPGNRFHYTNEYWSSVSIMNGMALGVIAGMVDGPSLAWDNTFGCLALQELGGVMERLTPRSGSDVVPYAFGENKGGVVAAVNREVANGIRGETCLPAEQISGREPCIPKHDTGNAHWKPNTRVFGRPVISGRQRKLVA